MRHKLLFKSPQFHPGLNLTVRMGPKWSEVLPGESVEIVPAGDEDCIAATGRVVVAVRTTFDDLPLFWLRYEHAAGARTLTGLRDAMDSAYGRDVWKSDITCLFFWV